MKRLNWLKNKTGLMLFVAVVLAIMLVFAQGIFLNNEKDNIATQSVMAEEPEANYLTFTANEDGSTVMLTKYGSPKALKSMEYSQNNGATWTAYTLSTELALNSGDKVMFRANPSNKNTELATYDKPVYAADYFYYHYFVMTGSDVSVSGNIMHLLSY